MVSKPKISSEVRSPSPYPPPPANLFHQTSPSQPLCQHNFNLTLELVLLPQSLSFHVSSSSQHPSLYLSTSLPSFNLSLLILQPLFIPLNYIRINSSPFSNLLTTLSSSLGLSHPSHSISTSLNRLLLNLSNYLIILNKSISSLAA